MKLKKKIIVGVLCLSLLLGVGSVFASRNAGEQLWSWYKSRFEAAKISIERIVYYEKRKYKTSFYKFFSINRNNRWSC